MITTATVPAQPDPPEVASAEALLSRGAHRITLPSGVVVVVRFPPLGALIRANAVPLDLREIAKAEIALPGGAAAHVGRAIAGSDPEKPEEWATIEQEVEKLRRFVIWLVAEHTLVEPRLTVEQLDSGEIDDRDLEMLIDISRRRVDRDARGVRLGVVSLEDAAVFREEHRCPPDCDGCARWQGVLSAPRVVRV